MKPFRRVAIIGLGLIGSSLARRLKRDGLADHIAGHARSAETRHRALELGFVDSVHEDPADAARGADMVVLCVPMLAFRAIGEAIAGVLDPDAVVTDTGSCKQSVIDDLAPVLPDPSRLVAAHPVAGTEHSGPDAGFPELFDGRWCIITPTGDTDPQAVERVREMWTACGMNVQFMSPEHHDLVLGITSHVPHLIAYTIVGTATDLQDDLKQDVIKFAAGGFRDFTRIAASDPTMWRDVFLTNKDAVLELLGRFEEDLTALRKAIRRGDGEALFDLFTRTRAIRRGIVDAGQHEWEDEKTIAASAEPAAENGTA